MICAQLCGLGHYGMKGTLVVDTPQDYQAWLKERAELAGTQTTPPAPTQRPPGEPISGAPPGTIPPPGAPSLQTPTRKAPVLRRILHNSCTTRLHLPLRRLLNCSRFAVRSAVLK